MEEGLAQQGAESGPEVQGSKPTLALSATFDRLGIRNEVDKFDKNKDGILDAEEVEALLEEVLVKRQKEKTLRTLLIASAVLAVLFCAATFGLTYAVVAAAKNQKVSGQTFVTSDGNVPIRLAQPTIDEVQLDMPADTTAYLAERYPAPVFNVTSPKTLFSAMGPHMYAFRARVSMPLSDLAAMCALSLDEGQSSLASSRKEFTAPDPLANRPSSTRTTTTVRIIGCVEAMQAAEAGATEPPRTTDIYRTVGGVVTWYSCHTDNVCDTFIRLSPEMMAAAAAQATGGAPAAPAGRRRLMNADHAYVMGPEAMEALAKATAYAVEGPWSL